MVALSSLSVAAADSTAAGGRLTARRYITTCTNSPRERRVGVEGDTAQRLMERDRKDSRRERERERMEEKV